MTDPGRVPATVTLKTGTGKAADGPLQSKCARLEFNLFEVLDLEKALATGEFGDLDGEAVRQMLAEAARLAQGPLANSFADGDRHPPQFDPDTHAVRLSESFKTSVWAWQRAGWPLLGLDEELGSVHVPATVNAAINEFLLGGQTRGVLLPDGPGDAQRAAPCRHPPTAALGRDWDRAQLGCGDGADRT